MAVSSEVRTSFRRSMIFLSPFMLSSRLGSSGGLDAGQSAALRAGNGTTARRLLLDHLTQVSDAHTAAVADALRFELAQTGSTLINGLTNFPIRDSATDANDHDWPPLADGHLVET